MSCMSGSCVFLKGLCGDVGFSRPGRRGELPRTVCIQLQPYLTATYIYNSKLLVVHRNEIRQDIK